MSQIRVILAGKNENMKTSPAGNIETCSCNSVICPSFQVFPIVNHLEQVVSSVYDRFWKIDPVSHLRYCLEGIYKGSVARGDCASVVIDCCARSIKARLASAWADHGGKVTGAQQGVLRPANTRLVLPALVVAECPPLGAHVNDSVPHHQATLGTYLRGESVSIKIRSSPPNIPGPQHGSPLSGWHQDGTYTPLWRPSRSSGIFNFDYVEMFFAERRGEVKY